MKKKNCKMKGDNIHCVKATDDGCRIAVAVVERFLLHAGILLHGFVNVTKSPVPENTSGISEM
ncbi:hypothetical protein [Paraburkholderia sacchari]|uniref:hypothetical protein n=1 Tax=Paraburkholderia sacchari TaxID=159450 RepID=UPI001269BF36|nr:hypothetical protein [Paraburkholderia sacchari]